MDSLFWSIAYVFLPSFSLWLFLNAPARQKINRLNSESVHRLHQYDEQIQTKMDAIWRRIENHLRSKNWEQDARLNPPATLEQIEALENELGYRLAADYKASLLRHNGSKGDFCSQYQLCSTKRSFSIWRINVDASATWAQERISPNPEKVGSYWWHPGWVPVASWDVYTVVLNVETGQIFYHDEANATYQAASWRNWLETVASRLESGELRPESDKPNRLFWWGDDYATPGSEKKQWMNPAEESTSVDRSSSATSSKQPTKRRLRFGFRTLLMLMTLLATLIASETNRYRHQHLLEKSFRDPGDYIRYAQRFEHLNSKFVSGLSGLIGPGWNKVVISVGISDDEMNERVFDSICQLKHIRNLGFSRTELTATQFDRISKMKSLQWLYFADTNIDEATVELLRDRLPNTFVNAYDSR